MTTSVNAVLDVGSNSIKFLAARRVGGKFQILADDIDVARLGDGVAEKGVLSPDAMARAYSAVKRFARRAREMDADVTAVGTQALREADNARDFIDMVKSGCGVEIRVISGIEEASLSFRAALGTSGAAEGEPSVVFDVGGGSSEVALGSPAVIVSSESVPVGALSLFRKFFSWFPDGGPIPEKTVGEAFEHVRSALTRGMPFDGLDAGEIRAVGVGGTFTTLASVCIRALRGSGNGVDGTSLSAGEISRQIGLYASLDSESRKTIPGLPSERADIILPGACIALALMERSRRGAVSVCARGLRHGVMESIFGACHANFGRLIYRWRPEG